MAHADGLYSVELDPELARQLASQGGTVLLLGVPQGTVIGIDQQVTRNSERQLCKRTLKALLKVHIIQGPYIFTSSSVL